jgi:hypothetical protein
MEKTIPMLIIGRSITQAKASRLLYESVAQDVGPT